MLQQNIAEAKRHTHTYHTVTHKRSHSQTKAHSHGHAKLLQPLLFQLFGLEEELKAALALVVSEVESVGPLQRERETHIFTHFFKT